MTPPPPALSYEAHLDLSSTPPAIMGYLEVHPSGRKRTVQTGKAASTTIILDGGPLRTATAVLHHSLTLIHCISICPTLSTGTFDTQDDSTFSCTRHCHYTAGLCIVPF